MFCVKKVNQPYASVQPSLSGNKSDEFQEKFTAARQRMDMYEIDKTQKQLQVYNPLESNMAIVFYYYHQALMGKQGVNPLKSAIPPFLQMPFFISMFIGLRGTLLSYFYIWLVCLSNKLPHHRVMHRRQGSMNIHLMTLSRHGKLPR